MSQKSLRGVWKLMKQGGFFSSHQALGKYFVMGCYRFVWASRWASATLLAFSENPETRAQWSNILFEGAFSKSLKGKKCAMQMPLRYLWIKIEEITKILMQWNKNSPPEIIPPHYCHFRRGPRNQGTPIVLLKTLLRASLYHNWVESFLKRYRQFLDLRC